MPIWLLPNVSIQGTSALNSLFDLAPVLSDARPELSSFSGWCFAPATSAMAPWCVLPRTFFNPQASPAGTAIRFSVETPLRGTWGSTLSDTNLQSFHVRVEADAQ